MTEEPKSLMRFDEEAEEAEEQRIRNMTPATVKPLTTAEIEGYRRTVELVLSGKEAAGALGYVRDMTRLLATIDARTAERDMHRKALRAILTEAKRTQDYCREDPNRDCVFRVGKMAEKALEEDE